MLLPLIVLLAAWLTPAPRQDSGKDLFATRCAACHGANATGGTFATSILPRISALDDASLEGVA